MHFSRRQTSRLASVAVLLVAHAVAAGETPPEFATRGELAGRLRAPVSLSWTNTPAIRALAGLSDAQRIAIVLDRRIDPGQPLDLAAADEPLERVLAKIAEQLNSGYCQFGPVAYFGPQATARTLRTLAQQQTEEVRSLPEPRVAEFLRLRTTHWDDLAEPRNLAEALAKEADVELVGAEQIPHDLWRATDLPSLTWIDRMTLLAAQFDLAFKIEDAGKRVRLVDAPQHVSIERVYPGGRRAAAVAKRWAREIPDARIVVEGDTIRVDGRLEDHEYVERRFRGSPTRRTKVVPGKEVYQLTVANAALDEVLVQVAGRLKLELNWEHEAIDQAGIPIEQLISVNVKDVSLDELLRAILDGTRLTYDRRGQSIAIRPADDGNSEPSP